MCEPCIWNNIQKAERPTDYAVKNFFPQLSGPSPESHHAYQLFLITTGCWWLISSPDHSGGLQKHVSITHQIFLLRCFLKICSFSYIPYLNHSLLIIFMTKYTQQMTKTIEATSLGIEAAPDSAPGAKEVDCPTQPIPLWLTTWEALS